MPDTLSITDNRTGKKYEIPITHGTIRAMDLRQIKVNEEDFGLMSYDPAFMNTASCQSKITFIDGDKGILRYRGYPIEQLAEKCSYLEVAYLVLYGELPTQKQLDEWTYNVMHHTMLHESIKKFMEGFHYDAHPMGMLVSTVGALSTFYPDARKIQDPESRQLQIYRLIGKVPTIAAYCYRHRMGLPYVYPDNDLSYTGNFLNMMYKMAEVKYKPNPVLERALDVLFILHADHEQNCSANAMRSIGSSHTDPFAATAGAAAALYGPLHGGANEQVLTMLKQIGSKDKIPDFIKRVKAGEGKLMGFGHRIYKNYDPRAKIIKQTADQVFEVTGRNPLLDMAIELERIALQDEYFIKRKLYPNVDFYSGIIYQAMGFPTDAFTVLFAIPRTSGWLAQWQELLLDPEQKIARPRQIYLGYDKRDFVPIEKRG
ncbi:MAG: citrate synthase [candidate division KSB1 bacterium]|nr:citrate synthase [candidate division KSB1 bacterium]MDZ7302603.1 citrate synthase [candidate division KSB1 bacterium]MDZ7311556.1 citrate synthase [candidate division KSB1 bacterium]